MGGGEGGVVGGAEGGVVGGGEGGVVLASTNTNTTNISIESVREASSSVDEGGTKNQTLLQRSQLQLVVRRIFAEPRDPVWSDVRAWYIRDRIFGRPSCGGLEKPAQVLAKQNASILMTGWENPTSLNGLVQEDNGVLEGISEEVISEEVISS